MNIQFFYNAIVIGAVSIWIPSQSRADTTSGYDSTRYTDYSKTYGTTGYNQSKTQAYESSSGTSSTASNDVSSYRTGYVAKYTRTGRRYTSNKIDYRQGFQHRLGSRTTKLKGIRTQMAPINSAKSVPELDPFAAESVIILLIGTVLVLHGRRRRNRSVA